MNLQSRNVVLSRGGTKRGKEQKSWAFKFYVLLYLLVTASVFFGAANYRIDLNRKINELRRSSSRAKLEIYEMERDIQALKLAKQQLSSPENIRKRIAEYNMQFRPYEASQVRYFTVYHRKRPAFSPRTGMVDRQMAMSEKNF